MGNSLDDEATDLSPERLSDDDDDNDDDNDSPISSITWALGPKKDEYVLNSRTNLGRFTTKY
jgi:hypothetical protein